MEGYECPTDGMQDCRGTIDPGGVSNSKLVLGKEQNEEWLTDAHDYKDKDPKYPAQRVTGPCPGARMGFWPSRQVPGGWTYVQGVIGAF